MGFHATWAFSLGFRVELAGKPALQARKDVFLFH